jgi:hypothetical protein
MKRMSTTSVFSLFVWVFVLLLLLLQETVPSRAVAERERRIKRQQHLSVVEGILNGSLKSVVPEENTELVCAGLSIYFCWALPFY